MRKLSIVGLSLLLALTSACGDDPQTPSPPQTSAPAPAPEGNGVPAGGEAGEVTVAMGETVALSTSVLGGEADRVEITVAGTAGEETEDGWAVTVLVTIAVRSGVYLASPANFVLVTADGTEHVTLRHTFEDVMFGVNAGETATGSLTFEIEGEGAEFDGATIAVYGIAEDAETLVARWRL